MGLQMSTLTHAALDRGTFDPFLRLHGNLNESFTISSELSQTKVTIGNVPL